MKNSGTAFSILCSIGVEIDDSVVRLDLATSDNRTVEIIAHSSGEVFETGSPVSEQWLMHELGDPDVSLLVTIRNIPGLPDGQLIIPALASGEPATFECTSGEKSVVRVIRDA